MGKRPDKEEVLHYLKERKTHLAMGLNLLGKLVGEDGLWGVKSWLSERMLSPSDSHSEEAGEDREDGGEEEEEEEEEEESSTSVNFLFRMPLIVWRWWMTYILCEHTQKRGLGLNIHHTVAINAQFSTGRSRKHVMQRVALSTQQHS